MASLDGSVISKIRQYATQARSFQEDRMDLDASELTQQLDAVVQELQGRVDAQKLALEKLRASQSNPTLSTPSADNRTRLQQLQVLKSAYDSLSVPVLPSAGSVVPALIAARNIKTTVSDAVPSLHSSEACLNEMTEKLRQERVYSDDANQLGSALEARLVKLRTAKGEQRQRSQAQLARDIIHENKSRKERFDTETERLQEALDRFVSGHLAGMLAAEELGGPVVGDLMDVDDEILSAGFSAQGKPKRTKSDRPSDESRRQKRIDEIWGNAKNGSQHTQSEREAAAAELDDLIRRLLDASLGDGEGAGHYVALDRESATARFLVRANVAQFHVKDANRLRLIDFGRELES